MAVRRYSRQRELIYRCVRESCEHPTAEMVYRKLKSENPTLSMGTVYRNLNLLAEDGLLTRMPFTVERYDAITEAHSHLLCRCCGRVLDVNQPYDPELDRQVQKETGCQIAGHMLIFEGICTTCLGIEDQKKSYYI